MITKKRNILRLFIGVVVFIMALIFIQIKKKSEILESGYRSAKLPNFDTFDTSGKPIKSDDFNRKILFVQFVNPLDDNDLELLRNVYLYWKNENLSFIIITKDITIFQSKFGTDLSKAIVLCKDYDNLKFLFRAPGYGIYYLYDKEGYLVNSGRNNIEYGKYLNVLLNRLIKNKYFSVSNFIRLNENVKNINWLRQVSEVVERENRKYYVISLFNLICTGCQSGSIIRNLNSLYFKNGKYVYFLCIVNDQFTEKDIIALKSQLGIEFSVIRADQTLSQKWNSLIQEFSAAELSGIVFISENSGKILRILDTNCGDCVKSFFIYLNNLIDDRANERK